MDGTEGFATCSAESFVAARDHCAQRLALADSQHASFSNLGNDGNRAWRKAGAAPEVQHGFRTHPFRSFVNAAVTSPALIAENLKTDPARDGSW